MDEKKKLGRLLDFTMLKYGYGTLFVLFDDPIYCSHRIDENQFSKQKYGITYSWYITLGGGETCQK